MSLITVLGFVATFTCSRILVNRVLVLRYVWFELSISVVFYLFHVGHYQLIDVIQSLMGLMSGSYRYMDDLLSQSLSAKSGIVMAQRPYPNIKLSTLSPQPSISALAEFICRGFCDGFCIGFNSASKLIVCGRNYPSSLENGTVVLAHISGELDKGCLTSPLPPVMLVEFTRAQLALSQNHIPRNSDKLLTYWPPKVIALTTGFRKCSVSTSCLSWSCRRCHFSARSSNLSSHNGPKRCIQTGPDLPRWSISSGDLMAGSSLCWQDHSISSLAEASLPSGQVGQLPYQYFRWRKPFCFKISYFILIF